MLVFISTSNEVLKSYKGLDEKIKAKLMDDINSSDLCFDGFKILISTIIDILSGKIKPIDINLNKTWFNSDFEWWIRHNKGGRMEKVGLNITSKEFKQLCKWSENIYNTAVVINYFVANQPEIEECYNLAPVIKHPRNDADVLNAFFINHEKDVEI